jgi:hypothetical protein
MNKFVAPIIRNLPACLAVSFAVKDLFAFRFLATREFGFETEFIVGASLGWLVSKKYRDRK